MRNGAGACGKHAALGAALLLIAGCSRMDIVGLVARNWLDGIGSTLYKLVLTLPFLAIPGGIIAFLVMGGAAAAPLRVWLFPWRWIPLAAFVVMSYALIWQNVAISEYRARQATQREEIATLRGAVESYAAQIRRQNEAVEQWRRQAERSERAAAKAAEAAVRAERERPMRANVPPGTPPHEELNAWLREQ
ncbi:MAG: hypothetical protein FLDDKLPJ_00938 [Phycisphaerae bacterium]|nr:hypothetical protein [Phycisphaerae bacterium]